MKTKIIVLISILTLASCNEKKEIEEFKIDVKTEKISENNYKVNIKTNFPENSSFIIDVERMYCRKDNIEKYSGSLYSNFSSLVKNGEINFEFKVDDKEWINDYKKYQAENASTDATITDIDFETIKDTIELSILYTPMHEKNKGNKGNKEVIGENGEFLKGEGVQTHKSESFKIFRKLIKIYNKFETN